MGLTSSTEKLNCLETRATGNPWSKNGPKHHTRRMRRRKFPGNGRFTCAVTWSIHHPPVSAHSLLQDSCSCPLLGQVRWCLRSVLLVDTDQLRLIWSRKIQQPVPAAQQEMLLHLSGDLYTASASPAKLADLKAAVLSAQMTQNWERERERGGGGTTSKTRINSFIT